MIASEATPDKNKLTTGTLTYDNLENSASYSAGSSGLSYRKFANGAYGAGEGYNMKGLTPGLSVPARGNADSTTTSAIAPGSIDVRENPNQDLSALNRDTSNALNELGRIFDKKKIEEQQELAGVFGEEAFKLAHKLPNDGKGTKILVHMAIGGIMSSITGAGFTSGVAGAGLNEAVIKEINKIAKHDPGTAQIKQADSLAKEYRSLQKEIPAYVVKQGRLTKVGVLSPLGLIYDTYQDAQKYNGEKFVVATVINGASFAFTLVVDNALVGTGVGALAVPIANSSIAILTNSTKEFLLGDTNKKQGRN